MKKGLFITLTSVALLAAPLNVLANGMSTVKVDGDKTATMGDIVEVKVKLTDIKDTLDGVVAFGGDLKYDKEYFLAKGELSNAYVAASTVINAIYS